MFRSAALKLTASYLIIIMILSVLCSGVIYRVSNDELTRDALRQADYFRHQLTPYDFSDFVNAREKQLDSERAHLINKLLLFNLIVLVGGGLASFALAKRTLEPIEESLEAQSRFTADASHELRTPLTAIQTEIEVALRNPKLNKDQAVELLKSNLEEVAKLKALSDGLLRLASGETKLKLDQVISLKTVAEQATERLAKVAEAKNVKIKKEIAAVKTRGDQQSLIDLVAILLDNAIKYSRPGSEVILKAYKKDKRAYIQIKDDGVGIKASDLSRIFERFYRADMSRYKDQPGGYGLGLAIAQKIAELHNGVIEVKSAPDKGSTFTVQLPLA